MQEDTHFLPGLSPVGPVEIHARFDGGALSSDGGVFDTGWTHISSAPLVSIIF